MAVENVLEWLEAQLQSGRFQTGDTFPSERVLVERLRVSRGVVREAKAKLAGRGVIVQKQQRLQFAGRSAGALFCSFESARVLGHSSFAPKAFALA
jgi:DNA-binding FadR family transcriptional regulator